jgi:hypothetical protein
MKLFQQNDLISVAIIDDGVNQNDFNLSGNWVIDKDLKITENPNSQTENPESHGTVCAKIIHKYLNKEAIGHIRFHSIAVLDSEMQGNVTQLLAAFELCQKLGAKVIHMSIGSSHYKDFAAIQKSVGELHQKGVVIVAAQSNRGVATYPACLPFVIGVKADMSLKDSQFRYFADPIDGIETAASSRHIFRNSKDIYTTPLANSYAAPVVTDRVISYLLENPNMTFDEIHNALKKDAVNVSEQADICDDGQNIEIPVILLEGFDPRELCETMRELKQKFLENDYNCQMADFVPGDLGTLKHICGFWMCDVLLLGKTDSVPLEYIDEMSVIVKNDAAGHENTAREVGDRVEIYLKDKDIGWLFETIMKTLT